MTEHPLRPIFEPRSVGVIGASADPGKRGHQVVAALQRSGFAGPIHPINPRGGEILGLPVAASVADLAEPPELVYVATPAAAVPDVVAACGDAGVRGAIVPAVGFGESGATGRDLEDRLARAARTTGIRVVGPNTSGLLNTHLGLHMVGGEPLAPGGLAIVSQSGNVALGLMTTAARRPLGVSVYAGPGNEIDVGFHEIIDFLASHEPTRAIVVYIEGLRHGRALYDVVKRVAPAKPIAVLKGGRSDAGVRAARSHTGSIAGSYAVFRAAAAQSGMIEVDASDELFAVGETLALQPPPRIGSGSGFVVISDGGGHGTIAADRLTALGVPLARLSETTKTGVRAIFGPASSAENPVDAAGAPDASPSVLVKAVETVVSDDACAGVLLIGLFGGYAIRFAASLADEEAGAAAGLARAAGEAGVPLVVHSLYERRSPPPLRALLEAGVPVYDSLEQAATCCAALWRRVPVAAAARTPRDAAAADALPPAEPPEGGPPAAGPALRSAAGARAPVGGGWLSEVESRALVAAAGVRVADGVFCRSLGELREAARRLPAPWALKAVSPGLPHKTEAGGVRLGIGEPEHLERAFEECTAAASVWLGVGVEGALLTPMLPAPVAELLIGARIDEAFGPILTVGFGGVDVELSPDVAIRLLPATPEEIRGMVIGLRRAPILLGHRGAPAADLDAIVSTAAAAARCLVDDASLIEVELNPVFVYEDGAIAVDAVARRRPPNGEAADDDAGPAG